MSSSGAWGPPPSGIDLSENQNASIITAVVVVMVFGLTAVVMRVLARMSRTGPGMGADDYVIIAAAILGIGNAACCLSSIQWGGGKHLWVVSLEQFVKLYQTTYAFVIVYINSVTLTKLSILLYYRRIFGTSIVWWIVFAFVVGHGAEVTVTWLAGCRPISYYWRQYTDPHAIGSCINASLFYFINGIIGMLTDVSILLVPIPTVCSLKMPASQKLLVCGILLLGGFVCIASVIRIVMMERLVKAQDFTWAMCQVFIWSCVEPFIGILCACLPTFAPFVRRWYTDSKSQLARAPVHYESDKEPKPHARVSDWSRIHELGSTPWRSGSDVELAATCVRVGKEEKGMGQGRVSKNSILVTKNFSLHRTT